jgi:uncharacterized membrane protein
MKASEVIIPKELIILIAFSVALNLLRVLLFGSYSLIYLLWNIFLAFAPFLISSTLLWHVHHAKVSRIEMIISSIFWLVLFPNAPYIVTDFVHLGYGHAVPIWFDILVIFSAAWIGLQFCFYSLLHIEGLLRMHYSPTSVRLMLLPILAFSCFGIYLGRFLRFNSWDIFTSPVQFIDVIGRIFLGTSHFPEAFFFSCSFFCFLLVTYTAWKLSKNAQI